jgi:biotin carboxylase
MHEHHFQHRVILSDAARYIKERRNAAHEVVRKSYRAGVRLPVREWAFHTVRASACACYYHRAMKDQPDGTGSMPLRRLRASISSLTAFALIAAPWPAWSQVERAVVAEVPAGSTPLALPPSASAGAFGLSPALSATALESSPLRSAPSAAPAIALSPAAAAPASSPLRAPAAEAAPAPSAAAAAAPAAAPAASAAAAAADESTRGKTVVMVGTKGTRPFIMEEAARVAHELGLRLVVVDEPGNRANSAAYVPDDRFIAAPIASRDAATLNAVAETVAAHPIGGKADVVTSFMSLYANVTAHVTERLHAAGIPGTAVAASDDKPTARRLLNIVPELEVPFSELTSAEEARTSYARVSDSGRYRVVLKTSRGENSRFLASGIDSADGAGRAFEQMDADVHAFVARPEAQQTTFAAHPGIMMERMLDKLPGTEETSVEVVMQNGRAAFAIVSDTLGIGPDRRLAGGILVFPSQQGEAAHKAMIEAAELALRTIGIENGNARLDMMMTAEGPRIIEINPFMGGVAIWEAVRSLTGVSLVEQGLRALLGLSVDPGHAPDGVAHYIFLASEHTGSVETVEGLDAARAAPGVVNARSFVSAGDTASAPGESTYEEWAEVLGKGGNWAEAIDAAVGGARRLILRVRRADGRAAESAGDYLQPTAADLTGPAEPAPAKAPGLFSKAVLGFLSTFVLVSTVVESTSLAVSQMTQPLSQGFMALAALTSVSYAAYTLGSYFGGTWIKKFGIRMSYRAVLAARAAIWTAIALLFHPATGTIALAALIPLFSLDYFFHSIGRVAEHSLQVAWFQNSDAASSRFGSFRDFIEYGSVFVGSAMALLVAKFGFAAVLYPAPIAFGVAALLALALDLPRAAPAGKPGRWSDGFKTVFKNSGIYTPLAGFALVNSFLYMMYYIVATAFGAYAAPDPQHAAGIAGSLTAVYGAGALAGSLVMDRLAARIDKRAQALPESERKAGERALYARSAARIMPWAAAALLGSWLFALPLRIGTLIWPIFPVSLGLLAIGFTAQMASNHLDVIMKSNIPKSEKDMAVGAIRTLTYATHVLGFIVWGGLFALIGPHAFYAFAAFYTGAGVLYLALARWLRARASKP